MWLFALLLAIPIIEIGLFIEVGGWIGLWPTLAIVILTAIAGTSLLRSQGRGALAELQGRISRGSDPTGPIAHGALILVAGILLLTPGFFTDAVGFALLIPPIRAAIIRIGAARFAEGLRSGRVVVFSSGGARPDPGAGPSRSDVRGEVIDGEYAPADPDPEAAESQDHPSDGSGWTRRP